MRDNIIQVIMCFFASSGFALLFNIHGKKLFWIGLGGSLSWIIYLSMLRLTDSVFVSMLAATMALVASAEILARTTHSPVIMLLAPMLIPMVPGGGLYYTMSYLIRDENVLFAESLRSLLMQAGAIAVGTIVMTSLMTNFFTFYFRAKAKKK